MLKFNFHSGPEMALLLAGCLAAPSLLAGGSGLNTLVVINRSSSNSCELGNYFCERRQVPPDNVLFLDWTGGNISWSSGDFQTNLVTPLLAALTARQLSSQIDYLVLSMDIPFQTINGTAVNSTTSALFYGLKNGADLLNSYCGSEAVFRQAPPTGAPGYSFLTCMITSDSLANAKNLVDQGVASDATFPPQAVVLAKSSDPMRSIRYTAFDDALFNTRLRGNYLIVRTNSDATSGQTSLLGYETGLSNFGVSPGTFVPGAMADSLTSYGGIIFGPNGQTTLLAFINAGASGSYGTVTEPTADARKFPDPQVYFYQARGFSLAECYYQSICMPYQGLIVGEPLAAPFQQPAAGMWTGISSNAVLSGTPQLAVHFAAADSSHPLRQVDLFVDGKFFQTLTNLAPAAGNVLTLNLPGAPLAYVVPANATLNSIATNLAALVNANAPAITASAHGDRVELRSTASSHLSPPTGLRLGPAPAPGNPPPTNPPATSLTGSSAGTAGTLTTFLNASRNVFLDSPVFGFKTCNVSGSAQTGDWLQITVTKINGTQISLAVTNLSATNTPWTMAAQLAALINSSPAWQGADGVCAEPLVQGFFNVRARRPGLTAAALQVRLAGASALALSPTTATTLKDNLSDLLPRNHLYVTTGATNLAVTFPLNTISLAEGFHELTAVAYEGSHVRTQTRLTLPVRVQNSSLSATLYLLDLPATAPVQGTYHLQVAANTNLVSTITLFSTGGALGSVSNQPTAAFTVNGSNLGAGRHPFYALVTTSSGHRYRTATQWIRLTN